MKTITIQIGNSDNKLTQIEWADFIRRTNEALSLIDLEIHFSGFSRPDAPWQNAAWVIVCHESKIPLIRRNLSSLASAYRQEIGRAHV